MRRDPTGEPPPNVAGGHPDDDLKAYADGELSPLRRALVRRHIARCARCQQETETMKKISVTFAADKGLNGTALAPDLRARLLGQMQAATPPPRVTPPVPLWRRSPGLVFGSGAVAALAMFAVFFPVFAKIRAQARQAAGEANQARVGIALSAQYSQDYDEAFPHYEEKFPPLASSGGGRTSGAAAPGAPPPLASSAEADYTPRARVPQIADKLNLTAADEADGRQVHKEGSIGLVIAGGKLESTSDAVEEIARTVGGFVASNNLQTSASDGYKSADLVIKAPVRDFEDVMKRLAKLGEVVAKSVNGEDITEKTSDAVQAEQTLTIEAQSIAARLKQERLSDRRTTQREAELRQVRIQLAQTRARLHLLRRLGALATITVSLTERPKTAAVAPPQNGFLGDLAETNRAAGAAFQSAVRVPIVLVVWILAFSPIWGTLLLAYRWASVRSDRRLRVASGNSDGAM